MNRVAYRTGYAVAVEVAIKRGECWVIAPEVSAMGLWHPFAVGAHTRNPLSVD